MIRRFTIKGFRRFEQTTHVDLDPVTVLVGLNNSGKSTVLQALNLFQYCVETTMRRANGADRKNGTVTLETRTVSPQDLGALPIADPRDLWPQGKASPSKPIVLKAEYASGASIQFDLGISFNRFGIRPTTVGDVKDELAQGAIRLVPIFSGFLPQEEYLTPPARLDRVRLQRHADVIRNLLWDLRDKGEDAWERLVSVLAQLFPESAMDIDFDIEVDRFIHASYSDDVLRKERDVIAAGSGFHQVLQIFASVLSPGARLVLLDEPDAHLHARLQVRLMEVFASLADKEGLQFVIATHSPHLLRSAPTGAIRACLGGRVVPFAESPQQFQLLEDVGAIDRMEIVPLLSNRAVVFVEGREDRMILEHFAQKLWGEKKQLQVLSRVSFLFTYQDPVAAGVLRLARQVSDLIAAPGMPVATPVRFLAVGDRDYRTEEMRKRDMREVARKAKTPDYKLTLDIYLWQSNEIENYLVSKEALVKAAEAGLSTGRRKSWPSHRAALEAEIDRLLEEQRDPVRTRLAARIQQDERRLTLDTAIKRADQELAATWRDGARWCDAKRVLSGLRAWLQAAGLDARLSEREIIDAMTEVPVGVKRVLGMIQRLGATAAKRPRPKKPAAAHK